MNRRGFSLFELMIVVAMVTTMSALGLASLSEIIGQARYRADRAKLFLGFTEARDLARDRRESVMVTLATGSLTFESRSGGCFGVATTTTTIAVPAVNAVLQTRCLQPNPGMGTGPMQFNDGVNPNDFIQNTNDGRFTDSWGEFGIEGAAQANLCDIEENPTCGR